MTGTFGGALEARGVRADEGRLVAEVEGEVETEDGVLVIRRIHARYRLRADEAHAAAIRRAFEAHPPKCPVYRTLSGCIDITTELDLLPLE
ncbi:OsmC family protein [Candidatus Palauibacter sp.]|uniref:OsmC family protein n=1 Tax=Candidatus Palauibacter sp. TaxID=3101350 RepID=UPI003AF2E7E5